MNYSTIENKLNGIADLSIQRILKSVFRDAVTSRIGRVVTGKAATNLSGGFFSGTTPAVANQEFSIAHSFGSPPYLLLPVLPVDTLNASIVRLTVSRVADANNVYLKSPETSQTVFVYLEG